jgi:hypothetical protein
MFAILGNMARSNIVALILFVTIVLLFIISNCEILFLIIAGMIGMPSFALGQLFGIDKTVGMPDPY